MLMKSNFLVTNFYKFRSRWHLSMVYKMLKFNFEVVIRRRFDFKLPLLTILSPAQDGCVLYDHIYTFVCTFVLAWVLFYNNVIWGIKLVFRPKWPLPWQSSMSSLTLKYSSSKRGNYDSISNKVIQMATVNVVILLLVLWRFTIFIYYLNINKVNAYHISHLWNKFSGVDILKELRLMPPPASYTIIPCLEEHIFRSKSN